MIDIQRIHDFVNNGGRFRVGENPVWGEPYYGEYMATHIQKQFTPGDKVDVVVQYPQAKSSEYRQFKGTILRINKGYVEVLNQGNSVWKDRKNYENIFCGHIKSISLIKRNPEFDIEKADPQGEKNRRDSDNEKTILDGKPDKYDLKYREELKEACRKLYPKQSFEDAVVMSLDFSIYFPWEVDKVDAEVYINHNNNSVKVAGKTGKPYPNKNVFGFYNDRNVSFGPSAFIMLPKDDYTGAFVTCKWSITYNDKVYSFISMIEVAAFEPVNGENNVYFIGDKLCPLAYLNSEYKCSEYRMYESLMDAEAMFYLDEKADEMLVIRAPKSEDAIQLYGFQSNLALSGYSLKKMINTLCVKAEQTDTRWNPEMWVTQCEVVPQFAHNYSYWQYNKKYEWTA